MDYSELAFLAKQKKISLQTLAETIGLKSYQGLQSSMEGKSIKWKNIELLCRFLEITPNELFGWPTEDVQKNGNYASHIIGGNTQNSNEAIQALREELKEKGGIIKEKDKQINRLLGIIEKGKKQ